MSSRPGRFFVLVALSSAILSFAVLPQKQAQSNDGQVSALAGQLRIRAAGKASVDSGPANSGFMIVRSGDGTSCRRMTVDEASNFQTGRQGEELRVLSDRGVGEQANKAQQGFKITLRGTSQLDAFPEARQAFLRAAARWESIIQSPITVVMDVDFGTTFFGTPFSSPNVIGGTLGQELFVLDQYSAVRSILMANAADDRQREIFSALPRNGMLTELGTVTNVSAESPIFRLLGALPPNADPEAEGFGSPPAIGFNSAQPLDFDPSDGIEAGKLDFENTAVHEIGHALGFTTKMGEKELAPSSTSFVTAWDFFRFRPGPRALSSLANDLRAQIAGGEQIFFAGDDQLPLSTAAIDGTGGDGQQGSHWKDDVQTGQYIGVMDPTGSTGLRDVITAADLTALGFFGYRINPAARVTELLSLDDGSREESLPLAGAIVVNRFTPSRYPATLAAVRVQLPQPTDGSPVVGQPLRLLAFVDANRTGQPPANPSLILDRTITIPALASGRFIEVLITTPPTINAGDLYVGVQSSNPNLLVGGDRTGQQRSASFVSTDNGASFQPLQAAGTPVNLILHAALDASFGSALAAAPVSLSPGAIAPGSQAFTLNVLGQNFVKNAVVRWNGGDRQTTFVNAGLLTAQISAADVSAAGTARVTVFNPGSGESAGLNFSVAAENPVPAISRLLPNAAAAGSQTPVTLSVFGTNFTPQSVVRVNGEARATTVVSSIQLNATIQASDLASAVNKAISVFTPGPGGGSSNDLSLGVVGCNYSLSITNHVVSSVGATPGTLITTDSPCSWTAVANAPWITVNPPGASGTGKFVVNYQIAPNTNVDGRTATLNIAGQTVNVRQAGRAASVSAASFLAPLAPDSIGAIFGAGLAKSTQIANSQPLPTSLNGTTVSVLDSDGVTRLAQLFFVSPGQINFLMPEGVATGIALVRISVDGQLVSDGFVTIAASAPSLFAADSSGRGLAAAVVLRFRADGTQTFEPVSRFDAAQNAFVPVPIDFVNDSDRLFLVLFGTGIRGRSSVGNITVKFDDDEGTVSFAGPQNDFAGLDQINAEIPRSVRGRGAVMINCFVDGRMANIVTVTIR